MFKNEVIKKTTSEKMFWVKDAIIKKKFQKFNPRYHNKFSECLKRII
jgi:hypothetical protein